MDTPPAAIREMQARLDVAAPIFLSRTIAGPHSFGVRQPVVILPERLLEMNEDTQRVVVCHELLHIRRRDWGYVIVEELIRALFWFHPAVWWTLGRIGLSRESTCRGKWPRLV